MSSYLNWPYVRISDAGSGFNMPISSMVEFMKSIMVGSVRAAEELRVKGLVHTTKPDESLVTNADDYVTKMFYRARHACLPEATVISEEDDKRISVMEALKTHKHVWLIDPIDGTSNFAIGSSNWGMSIALFTKEGLMAGGFVSRAHGLFIGGEFMDTSIFFPVIASEAQFTVGTQPRKVVLSPPRDGQRAIYGIGPDFDIIKSHTGPLINCRYLGASVSDIASFLLGYTDYFVGGGEQPHDIAGAYAVCQKAGYSIKTARDDQPMGDYALMLGKRFDNAWYITKQ